MEEQTKEKWRYSSAFDYLLIMDLDECRMLTHANLYTVKELLDHLKTLNEGEKDSYSFQTPFFPPNNVDNTR